MKKRRAFQKPTREAVQAKLKREWVSLEWGDVCVWGLTAAEMLALGQRSQRPSIDPRGGIDASAAASWLLALSARRDDQPGAERIWDDLTFADVLELSGEDFGKLSAAAQRVNGQGAEQVEATRDFTPATGAPNTSDSPSSASSSSTASPPNSTTSPTPN